MIYKNNCKPKGTRIGGIFLKNKKINNERKRIGQKQIPLKLRILEVTKWI